SLYDLYTRNASQAHLIHLLSALQGNPNQQQLVDIQNEISVTVNLARLATEQGPNNVDNWVNLAQVYQGIAGFVRGADEFAIKNYQEAHRLEPQNPSYPAEMGKIYLARAELQKPLLEARDEKTQREARKEIQENLKAAFESLHQAIAIKQDYLPAHYFLGAVHERQGRLKEAIGELEGILSTSNRDVGVAFELSLLYYRNNEKDRAIGLLEQIVNIDPNNSNARWYLALMYEERGWLDKALVMMRPLAEQFKEHAAVQQRYTSLKRAVAAKSPPLVQPLPEPLKEDIRSPSQNNIR
ncbi:MAG: tetratricopeptide repeat protein, partial [Candidatus Uhrbacteria bacterium]|nr:tetratricopeptide repeat protein [Candidatus Uhrbacteria bacterium]